MRNKNLDGARGLAALSVALAHSGSHYAGIDNYASTFHEFHAMDAAHIVARLWQSAFNGDAAVVLFFALSGYVLGRSLEKQGLTPAQAFVPYVVRRTFRIYPVCIAVAALVYLLFPITMHQMIGAMTLTDISANGVLWSLQVELLGSLVIFVIWALNRRALIAALLAFYAYFFWKVPTWALIAPAQFVAFPAAFVLGFIIPSVRNSVWRSRTLLCGALCVLLLSDLLMGRTWHTRIGQILGAFALVGCLHGRPIAWLNSKPIQFAGLVSYPFYLIQLFVAVYCDRWVESIAPHASILWKIVLLCGTSIPIALAVALAITVAIERPGIRLGSALLALSFPRHSRPSA